MIVSSWVRPSRTFSGSYENGSTPLCTIEPDFISEPDCVCNYSFMKKYILIPLAIFFLSVAACTKSDDGGKKGKTFIHVIGVTLDKSKLTLVEDEKATLVATIAPEDAIDKSVEWSSDKPEVASVDDKGEVTAKAAGIAAITVNTKDGGKTATCVVTVEPKSNVENPEEGGEWGWD